MSQPAVNPATLDLARVEVAKLLSASDAFRELDPASREEIARNTARIAAALADPATPAPAEGTFVAQGAREGAAAAGALMREVNFPTFVASLVEGVFHAIVESSIEQMEAYGKLVADVAKSLNDFRDENVSVNQGRDHLVEQFPDTFQLDIDTGEDGGPAPRVRLRDGVDDREALKKVSQLPVEGAALRDLDDETIEERLVPAARTQLASSRQQLLATMVVMGINRIVVTDGRISAKVMYDFQARDNFRFQKSATKFDYGDQVKRTSDSEREYTETGGQTSGQWNTADYSYKGANRYLKGRTHTTEEPVLKLASASQEASEATLQTRASLAGSVDINFKSDYLPLEKMADSFQIANIQQAAAPGRPAPGTTPPAATPPATAAPVATP